MTNAAEAQYQEDSDDRLVFSEETISRRFSAIQDLFARADFSLQLEIYKKLQDPNRCELVLADLGCGRGNSIEECLRGAKNTAKGMGLIKPVRAIGVDLATQPRVATDVLDIGSFNGVQTDFRQGDMRALPIGDGEVDLAYSVSTLHVVPDALRALEEAYRILAPGGIAIFEVLDSEVSRSPSLKEIFDSTPGAKEIFNYEEVEAKDGKLGFIICNKKPGVDFKGFKYAPDSNVKALNWLLRGKFYRAIGDV